MSATERAELCDDALIVGEDQPTLCGEWTVKDLVVHLLLREGSAIAAPGIFVPALSRLTDVASRRLAREDFAVLVERLRKGPPIYSPYAVSKLDAMFNTLEYFVHHEDIRRAQPTWEPRVLTPHQEKVLWKQISVGGLGLVRGSEVGVTIERSDKDDRRAVLSQADPMVVVRGLPSELTLFLFGRKPQARVELVGPDDAVAVLHGASLGI
jgi:uncharacterized protein (TIGR03085 family)